MRKRLAHVARQGTKCIGFAKTENFAILKIYISRIAPPLFPGDESRALICLSCGGPMWRASGARRVVFLRLGLNYGVFSSHQNLATTDVILGVVH